MKTEFNRLKLYILFDGMFYLYLQSGLDLARKQAEKMMGEYNFKKAQLCLKSDDTVLMTIEKE